ncbi:hypothetical protein JDV09_06205 [Mycobacterium sp. Y57]|uniref:hypothetical protein n=1 Tax=Mycolicibacterium xanthum TaxID=2796469 RepID=UPI001C85FF18|nr:hypothetical protein [Mycolicibacterium xanthum]MBX7431701.1 hypothetical protein [Mycolicibacterium xanthum]
MTKTIAVGIALVVLVQLFAVAWLDRDVVMVVSGVALAGVLLAVLRSLTHLPIVHESAADDGATSLRRWLSRTETTISWSESSRADWDRRLRPMLARQFELAAGQRRAKDPHAFAATGRMLFGEKLWRWVDPDNISRSGTREPGPGRDTLHDILQRLDQL